MCFFCSTISSSVQQLFNKLNYINIICEKAPHKSLKLLRLLDTEDIPLTLQKEHDYCTILLGARDGFKIHFSDNLSVSWSCNGYMLSNKSHLHASKEG